jgi:hypothetical protein
MTEAELTAIDARWRAITSGSWETLLVVREDVPAPIRAWVAAQVGG